MGSFRHVVSVCSGFFVSFCSWSSRSICCVVGGGSLSLFYDKGLPSHIGLQKVSAKGFDQLLRSSIIGCSLWGRSRGHLQIRHNGPRMVVHCPCSTWECGGVFWTCFAGLLFFFFFVGICCFFLRAIASAIRV